MTNIVWIGNSHQRLVGLRGANAGDYRINNLRLKKVLDKFTIYREPRLIHCLLNLCVGLTWFLDLTRELTGLLNSLKSVAMKISGRALSSAFSSADDVDEGFASDEKRRMQVAMLHAPEAVPETSAKDSRGRTLILRPHVPLAKIAAWSWSATLAGEAAKATTSAASRSSPWTKPLCFASSRASSRPTTSRSSGRFWSIAFIVALFSSSSLFFASVTDR